MFRLTLDIWNGSSTVREWCRQSTAALHSDSSQTETMQLPEIAPIIPLKGRKCEKLWSISSPTSSSNVPIFLLPFSHSLCNITDCTLALNSKLDHFLDSIFILKRKVKILERYPLAFWAVCPDFRESERESKSESHSQARTTDKIFSLHFKCICSMLLYCISIANRI